MSNATLKQNLYRRCPRRIRPYWDRVETSELGYRLARGTFWSLVGAIVARGLVLASTIIVARFLGKQLFGEFGMVRTTVMLFGTLASVGFGLTATKHVAEFRKSDPARTGRIIVLSGLVALCAGGFLAILVYVLAPLLASKILVAPHLSGLLRIGSLLLFLTAINGAQTGTLAGFEAFKAIARVNLLAGLASFPILVTGVVLAGIQGAVWGAVISLAINGLLSHIELRREADLSEVTFSVQNCLHEWPILWRFSLPAALSAFLLGPVSWVGSAILVNQTGGYGELGIFNAASQWMVAILMIPEAFRQTFLPVLATIDARQESARFGKVLRSSMQVSLGVSLGVAVSIVIISPLIMAGYGKEFASGVTTLSILACAAGFIACRAALEQVIISKGSLWVHLLLHLLWGGIFIGSAAWLTMGGYGANGLASAYLISNVFLALLQGCYVLGVWRCLKQNCENEAPNTSDPELLADHGKIAC